MFQNIDKFEKVHLALTYQHEFWDPSKTLVFLGPWCLRKNENLHLWEPYKHNILPSPWENKNDYILSAIKYVDTTCEQLFPIVADCLNKIHNTDFSLRYWRIITYKTLHDIISILYDRYIYLKTALSFFPNLTTVGLSQDSYYVPEEGAMLAQIIENSGMLNLQFFSQLSDFLRINIVRKKCYWKVNSKPFSDKSRFPRRRKYIVLVRFPKM